MAIRTVVTRGYGNVDVGTGNYAGTIALVVTRGYAIKEATAKPIVTFVTRTLNVLFTDRSTSARFNVRDLNVEFTERD